jgi:predicted dehydrogenase
VYCHEWNPEGSWYDRDAAAVAVFEMTDDIVYVYQGSWCAEGCRTSWEAEWRVVGTEGTVLWDGADGLHAEVIAERGERSPRMEEVPIRVPDPDRKGRDAVIDEFIRCVRTGGTPETHAADNIRSLAMVFGAIESAEAGRKVEIRPGAVGAGE